MKSDNDLKDLVQGIIKRKIDDFETFYLLTYAELFDYIVDNIKKEDDSISDEDLVWNVIKDVYIKCYKYPQKYLEQKPIKHALILLTNITKEDDDRKDIVKVERYDEKAINELINIEKTLGILYRQI